MSIEDFLKLLAQGGVGSLLVYAGAKQLFFFKWYVDELRTTIKEQRDEIKRQDEMIDKLTDALHSSANTIETRT